MICWPRLDADFDPNPDRAGTGEFRLSLPQCQRGAITGRKLGTLSAAHKLDSDSPSLAAEGPGLTAVLEAWGTFFDNVGEAVVKDFAH
jgi:hypothetical protein